MALAAYSRICSMTHGDVACQLHGTGSAVLAGLTMTNGIVAEPRTINLFGFGLTDCNYSVHRGP